MSDTKELRRKACLALEGSIQGADAMKHISVYLDHCMQNAPQDWLSDPWFEDLFFFLSKVRNAFNPDGDSEFVAKIVQRTPGNVRTPRERRLAKTWRLTAALLVEDRVAAGELRKNAIADVSVETGVSRAEIYKAKKDEMFKMVMEGRAKKSK